MRVLSLATAVLCLGVLLVSGCGQDVTDPSVVAPEVREFGYGLPQWYTMGWQLDGSYVLRLETRTGLGTLGPLMNMPRAFPGFGMAFDLDGTCYAFAAFLDGQNASYFARIDIQTGVCTPINIDTPYDIIFAGPDIDSHGDLYVTGFTVGAPEAPEIPLWWGGYDLWRVNKATGELTLVGDTRIGTGGEFAGEWMDLAFDSQDRCWTTCRNKLFLLDTTDGHATFVTDISGVPTTFIPEDECPDDWQWMEVMDIAFDEHDILWASAIRGFSPCLGFINSPVMWIDVNTGQATVVGYAHTGGQNHGGDIMPVWVTVAHREPDGTFNMIRVRMQALPDHLAHGDYVPGTVGDPGYPG